MMLKVSHHFVIYFLGCSRSYDTCAAGSTVAMPTGPLADGSTMSSDSVGSFSSVDRWLTAIKMDRYQKVFRDAGCTTLADVSQIQPNDLARLGITLSGHKKKLLSAIRALLHSVLCLLLVSA